MPWYLWVIFLIPVILGLIAGFLPGSEKCRSGVSGIYFKE
jgi:hypothetical protein